ncbi:hypothetical protein EGT74_16950 [Chitinophaga lutea]|uniref:Uncharacterized protein n=1 Tax=Chitinophaga lutea TaxID=2488634 RepID=A0A3N4PJ54_9BACT|nr:hypothetical protein [Chitinophaga lutea]RPE08722.1 hypothetical protein EGT74_16950 [Chitinophaga lutea]
MPKYRLRDAADNAQRCYYHSVNYGGGNKKKWEEGNGGYRVPGLLPPAAAGGRMVGQSREYIATTP